MIWLARFCVLCLSLVVGCGSAGPDCRVGADCASGICLSDGTCLPLEGDGGQDGADGSGDPEPDGGDSSGDGPVDGSDGSDMDRPDGDAGGDAPGDPITCTPEQDGIVDRDEVPQRAGLRATYRISGQTQVDTAGVTQPDGSRSWDLAGDLDGDHLAIIELFDPIGAWWAPSFPDATYAAQLRDDEDLLGVFQAGDDAILLLGVVSPDDGVLRTELTFDPPVTVLSFPLQPGHAWTTEATVSGWAMGAWTYYSEDYESQVDAHGEVLTPYGALPVLRVSTNLTRTVGLMVTRVRSFLFVAECFGTVATIHSTEGETEVEFTQAAEVRRLAP